MRQNNVKKICSQEKSPGYWSARISGVRIYEGPLYVCANNIIIITVYSVNFLACQWRHIFGEIIAWSFDTLIMNNAWLGWNDRSDCIPRGRSVKETKNSTRKLYYFRHICSSFGEWAITSFFNEIELLKIDHTQ